MQDIVLRDTKSKFAKVRELCPGMNEDMYAITDYISESINDITTPHSLLLLLVLIMDDIHNNGNGIKLNVPLPENLINRGLVILEQFTYIPQIVDEIADERFAKEFRRICNETLGFNPPKRDFKRKIELQAEKEWLYSILSGDINSSLLDDTKEAKTEDRVRNRLLELWGNPTCYSLIDNSSISAEIRPMEAVRSHSYEAYASFLMLMQSISDNKSEAESSNNGQTRK